MTQIVMNGCIEVVMQMFAIDAQYRTSIHVCRILSEVIYSVRRTSQGLRDALKSIVIEQFNELALTLMPSIANYKYGIINILLTIGSLESLHPLTSSIINALVAEATYENGEHDYFYIVSLLAIICEANVYPLLADELWKAAERYVVDELTSLAKSDVFMLAVDMLCCPYFSVDNKIQIAKKVVKYCTNNDIKEVTARSFIIDMNNTQWYFDWNRNATHFYIAKKEFTQAY